MRIQKRGFTARGTSRRVTRDNWVLSQAPKRVISLSPLGFVSYHHHRVASPTYHDTLWKVGLANYDSTQLLQDVDQHRILGRWLERPASVAKSSIVAFDVELVFQADWDSVKGSFCFAFFGVVLVEFSGLS